MDSSLTGKIQVIKPGRFIGPDEISKALSLIKERAIGKTALIGGVALAYLGCPRMTGGVDVASLVEIPLSPMKSSPLSSGGASWKKDGETSIKVVIRADEYKKLYEEAIQNAVPGVDEFPTATPEYLAAMKFAAQDIYQTLDLKWLLGQPGLVDRKILHRIVYDCVGGRFAKDALEILDEDVQLDIEQAQDRDESSYP